MTETEQPRLISATAAAARLGVSRHVVYKMVANAELPVAHRSGDGEVRLNWPLIDRHLACGGKLTPNWWVTAE